MRMVYIDPIDFKCYPTQNTDGTRIPYESSFFNDKCDTFIMGWRIVPEGYSWTNENGEVFNGKMVSQCEDYFEMENAQREYERQRLAEYESALTEIETALGV